MKYKYLFILAGIIMIVILVMAFISLTPKKLNQTNNGFSRGALKKVAAKLHQLQLTEPVLDIAGMADDRIYLVTRQPDKLLVTNMDLDSVKTIRLDIDVSGRLWSNFTSVLQNHFIFIAVANLPGIIRYDLQTNKAVIFKTDRAFSRCAVINDRIAVIRGFNASFDDEIIRRIDLNTGSYFDEKGITDKTTGGGFITDGLLHYDLQTNSIVYNHFYSNKVLLLDTGLHLLYKGTTIDTFKMYTAHAKSINTKDGVRFTFTKPPLLLSLHSCVDGGRLFIYSRLKADNETAEQFRNNTIIDTYEIASGKYTGSFYIPLEDGRKMFKFKVIDNLLIAVYDQKVVVYEISSNNLL